MGTDQDNSSPTTVCGSKPRPYLFLCYGNSFTDDGNSFTDAAKAVVGRTAGNLAQIKRVALNSSQESLYSSTHMFIVVEKRAIFLLKNVLDEVVKIIKFIKFQLLSPCL